MPAPNLPPFPTETLSISTKNLSSEDISGEEEERGGGGGGEDGGAGREGWRNECTSAKILVDGVLQLVSCEGWPSVVCEYVALSLIGRGCTKALTIRDETAK